MQSQKISKSFESEREVRVYTNFASSQTLQVQIERGAPADLFISASPVQMDALQEKGAIHESSRRNVLRNSLVLVAPTGSSYKIERPEELAGSHTRRIAIGEPSFRPGGHLRSGSLETIGNLVGSPTETDSWNRCSSRSRIHRGGGGQFRYCL